MGLFEKGFKENTGSGNSLGDGFFANQVKITSVEDLSGTIWQTKSGTNRTSKAPELALRLWYEDTSNPDKGRFPLEILGNFARDEQSNAIIGAGSAFKLDILFEAVGYTPAALDDKDKFTKEALDALVGREIVVLSYPNNQGKTYKWDIVGVDGSELKDRFMKSKRKPDSYRPKGMDSDPFASSVPTESNSSSTLSW